MIWRAARSARRGLSRMGGKIQGVTIKPDTADSVDEDDGAIDGANHGARTRSLWFAGDGASLTLSFNAQELGRLPTHVGFVITDCSPNVNTQIDVFDGASRLLAKHRVYHSTFATADRRCGKDQAAKARFCRHRVQRCEGSRHRQHRPDRGFSERRTR